MYAQQKVQNFTGKKIKKQNTIQIKVKLKYNVKFMQYMKK